MGSTASKVTKCASLHCPPESPRGGVLTQGTVLAVTSNPDRTSPVKRGLFILDNILGIPPPPPPPNIPPLEEAAKEFAGRTPTLRETLELHRKRPSCSSCHNRMDPLGLALENFDALGRWREREQGNPVDSTGRLITGESFSNVQELKRILADEHRRDFFRCLSEKMLTYALGRGLDYRDVETVDKLVDRLERENGRASALISGIVESTQFQRRQRPAVGNPPNRTDQTTAIRRAGARVEDATMSSTNPGEIRSEIVAPRGLRISRRHFLRGLGVAVALPVLASLRPTARFASRALPIGGLGTTPTGAPLRAAFVYVPNGAIPAAWWPTGEGSNFQLSRSLQPLAADQGPDSGARRPGPSDGGLEARWIGAGEHARANGTFLTGVRLKKSATDIHAGISIDQVLARQIGPLTRFASLELGCDAVRKTAACDSGYSCAYQYNLSWSSPTTPVTPESNPRLVFERLFGTGAHGERQANLQRRRLEQRSLLDFVLEDARSMQKRLNPQDQDKLDQYLSSVREIETRIERAEQFGAVQDPGVATPAGIPADYTQYVQLMYDMLFWRSRPTPRAWRLSWSITTGAICRSITSGSPRVITTCRTIKTGRIGSKRSPRSIRGTSSSSPGSWKSSKRQKMPTATPCSSTP